MNIDDAFGKLENLLLEDGYTDANAVMYQLYIVKDAVHELVHGPTKEPEEILMNSNALKVAYQAILQVNMLAGPFSIIEDDNERVLRIRDITDKTLKTLNSDHKKEVVKALGSGK